MLLATAGIDVRSALDGEAALDRVLTDPHPDLVISDYRLPGISGVEVVRRVRGATSADLPAVIMTGDTAAIEIEQADLDNCVVLHKPVDTDRLIALIQELVE